VNVRTRSLATVCLGTGLALGLFSLNQPAAAAQDTTEVPFPAPSGTVETRSGTFSFPAGYPSKETSGKLYDEMDYQRAVQAYIWATPLVNSVGAWKALTAAGGNPAEPAMLVIDKPLSPKQIVTTGNDLRIHDR
jgi:hypothetical protein